MYKRIKESSLEIIEHSSIHGLPNIISIKRTYNKIMWIIFTLLSACVSIYLVVRSFQTFLSYDVITRIDDWPQNPLNFPTVSICNLNQPKTNYSLEEILIDCTFNGNECLANNFTNFYDMNFGLCYRFNSNGLLQSTKPGKLNGLKIEMFAGLANDYEDISSTSNGLHVYIHNRSSLPSISEGIDVATEFRTNIVVKQIFNIRQPFPYNDCKENADYFQSNVTNDINILYRQKDCFDLKFLQEFAKSCGYSGSAQEIIKSFRSRLLSSEALNSYNCLSDANLKFYNQNLNSLYSNDCPLECSSIIFSTFVSMSKFPSVPFYKNYIKKQNLIKLFNGNFTIDQLSESVVSFIVYYEEMRYTVIRQDPKLEIVDLISNIGGLFGLFLGTSFLSFLELVEILNEIIFIIYETKFSKRVSNL